mgnify:CR=1 FL=1
MLCAQKIRGLTYRKRLFALRDPNMPYQVTILYEPTIPKAVQNFKLASMYGLNIDNCPGIKAYKFRTSSIEKIQDIQAAIKSGYCFTCGHTELCKNK